MKKIIYSIALLSGMMFYSCEDMLDIPQKGTDPIDGFYKTDADAESAVTAMYATYIGEIGGNEGIWSAYIMGLNYSSDDVFAAGGDTNDHADFRVLIQTFVFSLFPPDNGFSNCQVDCIVY